MIKIFNSDDRDFSSAGNIVINPTKCLEYKKKSLNGWYIEVEIPIKYKEYIEKDKLCVVKTKSKLNSQAFRIGENIKYTNRKISFTANHVMFDAQDYFLLDVRPTNLNGLNALNYINQRTDNISPFTMYSNVEAVDTAYFIRKSLLEAWATIEEQWDGVFDADNWNISFLQNVGHDNGESIIYGKNMQSMEIYEDWSNVVTRLYPVGPNELMLPEEYVESDIEYEKPYTKTINFQTELEQEEQTEEALIEELRTNAEAYLEENQYPKMSYTTTSNINNNMEIGDTIHVLHPLVSIETEVLEYQHDILSKKIKSLTFGNFTRDVKTKFNNIKETINQIGETVSKQEIAIKQQTDLINSLNKNGYVYIDENEILILDKIPKEEAENVWRFGLGGIGFSSNGYEGPFELAMTMDGQINANFITTGKMSVARIEGLGEQLSLIVTNIQNIGTTTVATGDNIKIDASENPAKLKLYGKTVQKVTEQGVNLCPDIDKWTLAGGAYIEDGYIVFPSLNSSASMLVNWNGTTPVNDIAQLYLGFIFNSETLENRPHISAIYYDENMTYLTENGHVSSKNAEDNEYWYMHNFNQNVSTTYGAAIRDAKYIRFGIKYSNSSLGSFKIKNPLVSKVSNSEYVPFVPDSPSKAYPSPINAVGDNGEFDLVQHRKNVFDSEDWYETLHAISNTSMTKETIDGIEYYKYSPAQIYTYQYMKGCFKENTQYILSCKARKYDNIKETSTGFTFRYTDGTRQSIYVNNTLTEYDMVLVSQAGKTIDSIGVPYAYGNYVLVRNIQVEEVVETTEPTEYVEYWENRYPITTDKPYCSNLGQTIFDTIEEREIDGVKKWCRVKSYEQKILNGTEYWYATATNVFRLELGTIAKTGICTHYKYAYPGVKTGIYMENSLTVIITDTDYDNLADFKAYLAEQAETDIPVKIQYQLQEPVIEALSDDIQDILNSITTKKGINYFYIDDPLKPNIEIEYYPNTPYNENLANKDDLNRTKKEMSAEIQINADNIAHTVEETTTNIREIENELGEVIQKQESVESNVSKLEQDSTSMQLALEKSGGNNLVKNSAMYNDHNFWFGGLSQTCIESDTVPTSAIEGQFWYCTENVEDYKKGYIYEYEDGEWVETSWNRKNLEDLNSLFKVVSIREDDDTRKNTVSGRVIRYTPTGNADETHIFNMTNRVQYKDYEPNIIAHCKIKNSTETGTVMLILAFTDFDFETEPLNNIELIVESGYEPAVILTPDDCQNMSEIEINVKMPKKTDFLPVVTGTTAPTDTTKLWLDTSINLIKEYVNETWTIKETITTAYDETTRKIWTYRPFFSSYYETSKNFDNFEFKSIYAVIYYLGGLNIISSTTEPTPVKGAYWYNPTTNVVKRAKYNGTEFVEWIDTNTTLESLPCPPFPTNVQVPMKGYFEIADLKIEYNNTKTRWAQYEGENYSKNYKWDERGMYIESGQNIMYIDEDEILATYKSNAIFFIKEDLSYLKYLQTEKIQIGNYFLEEKNINNKDILCLY